MCQHIKWNRELFSTSSRMLRIPCHLRSSPSTNPFSPVIFPVDSQAHCEIRLRNGTAAAVPASCSAEQICRLNIEEGTRKAPSCETAASWSETRAAAALSAANSRRLAKRISTGPPAMQVALPAPPATSTAPPLAKAPSTTAARSADSGGLITAAGMRSNVAEHLQGKEGGGLRLGDVRTQVHPPRERGKSGYCRAVRLARVCLPFFGGALMGAVLGLLMHIYSHVLNTGSLIKVEEVLFSQPLKIVLRSELEALEMQIHDLTINVTSTNPFLTPARAQLQGVHILFRPPPYAVEIEKSESSTENFAALRQHHAFHQNHANNSSKVSSDTGGSIDPGNRDKESSHGVLLNSTIGGGGGGTQASPATRRIQAVVAAVPDPFGVLTLLPVAGHHTAPPTRHHYERSLLDSSTGSTWRKDSHTENAVRNHYKADPVGDTVESASEADELPPSVWAAAAATHLPGRQVDSGQVPAINLNRPAREALAFRLEDNSFPTSFSDSSSSTPTRWHVPARAAADDPLLMQDVLDGLLPVHVMSKNKPVTGTASHPRSAAHEKDIELLALLKSRNGSASFPSRQADCRGAGVFSAYLQYSNATLLASSAGSAVPGEAVPGHTYLGDNGVPSVGAGKPSGSLASSGSSVASHSSLSRYPELTQRHHLVPLWIRLPAHEVSSVSPIYLHSTLATPPSSRLLPLSVSGKWGLREEEVTAGLLLMIACINEGFVQLKIAFDHVSVRSTMGLSIPTFSVQSPVFSLPCATE